MNRHELSDYARALPENCSSLIPASHCRLRRSIQPNRVPRQRERVGQEVMRQGYRLRFLEMGVADVRGPGSIAERYRGVSYQAFVLSELMQDPERTQALL